MHPIREDQVQDAASESAEPPVAAVDTVAHPCPVYGVRALTYVRRTVRRGNCRTIVLRCADAWPSATGRV